VPSPDPLRLAVPKAYVALVPGHEPTRETALSILAYARERLAPYKRVRRLEFAELPKTISGKIRRVELRARGTAQQRERVPRGGHARTARGGEADVPRIDLRGALSLLQASSFAWRCNGFSLDADDVDEVWLGTAA
jgi:hypothetical protein